MYKKLEEWILRRYDIMVKPVKKYDVKYPQKSKRTTRLNDSKEIYMCEYVDCYAKKQLPEDQITFPVGM